MSDLHPELGSSEVHSHEDRPIIHFGSPTGAAFHKEENK